MSYELAFDVYGTLIDTQGVVDVLTTMVGPVSQQFSAAWRAKQLEYTFRRGLMRRYVPFDTCTAQALRVTAQSLGVTLSAEAEDRLLLAYQRLPPFPDAAPALNALAAHGHRCHAFSNGSAAGVSTLLRQAGLGTHFVRILSVEDVRSFKPDPAVYEHLVHSLRTPRARIVMISSNPFDVLGARAAGLASIWVKRSEAAVMDPWEFEPSATLTSLGELPTLLASLGRETGPASGRR